MQESNFAALIRSYGPIQDLYRIYVQWAHVGFHKRYATFADGLSQELRYLIQHGLTGLAVMTKLESLTIGFDSYFLASLGPLPAMNFSAHATLPTLTQFQY